MATHVKIITREDAHVHYDTGKCGLTLCGLETGGDGLLGIEEAEVTTDKVTCHACLEIVAFCAEILQPKKVKKTKKQFIKEFTKFYGQ